ncbi:uncharacterized protein LOC111808815 isoform X1 [Cucurbita pepo subsp. pepo]|uniref:uncharacterized protein LOC111808815 isoform X1 n=1 Tax=Cucurbita pepo subsp. pepo TaxID=3664 RepID=UPI000C9DA05B|nr:uncharacterized protein LOC111808815 isoform X1 [Cucurbita pepo subsp. pepo]
MATKSHSVSSDLISIDDDNLECRSISELVSILRTAFRARDFDKVEAVLVAKEVKMRKEIENKNKEYELLQSKYEFLRLDILTHESMLEQDKVDPKGFEKWKEIYEDLKEKESEIQQLKDLIFKVNEDREKKKSALEGFEKLLETVKKAQEDQRITIEKLIHKNSELECAMEVVKKVKEDHVKTIEELRCKNLKLECSLEELNYRKSELERTVEVVKKTEEDERKYVEELKCKNSKLETAKREAEHNYELCRRKYDELGRRVSQLENKNDSISGGACVGGSRKLVGMQAENRTGTEGFMVEIISDDDHAPVKNSSRARRKEKRTWDLLLNDCEDYDPERDDEKISTLPSETNGKEALKKVGAMYATPPHGRPDNHVLKRHLSTRTNDSKNVMSSSRAVAVMLREECKSHNSMFKYASFGFNYFNEDCSFFSDSDCEIQNRYDSTHLKSKGQGKRSNKKWESEAEMRAAFDENDMLCMEAVCILYRQSSLVGKPRSAYLPSRHRGFHEVDLLRGSTLALFLTGGDSQGKLKRSVMELEKFDICGLIDCRRISIEHLEQLFEIYKNSEDQFLFQ